MRYTTFAQPHAYVEAGATAGWVAFPKSKRIEFYGKQGTLQQTRFEIDLTSAVV